MYVTSFNFLYFFNCFFFQTVLESGSVGNASSSDEELEQWEQIFMMRDENGNSYNDKLVFIYLRISHVILCDSLVQYLFHNDLYLLQYFL